MFVKNLPKKWSKSCLVGTNNTNISWCLKKNFPICYTNKEISISRSSWLTWMEIVSETVIIILFSQHCSFMFRSLRFERRMGHLNESQIAPDERKNWSLTISWRSGIFKNLFERCQQKLPGRKTKLCGISETISSQILWRIELPIEQREFRQCWATSHQGLIDQGKEKRMSKAFFSVNRLI